MACAILRCCASEQFCSIDKITGYSDVTNACSLIVLMTSRNLIFVVNV